MLAYSDQGRGSALLFAHGIGSDRSRWDSIIERLVADFRCVAVDLPGHGESPDEGCDSLSAASGVHEVVQHLGLEAPVIVGHSLGGTTALVYAALFGPRSIVAVDAVPMHLPTISTWLAPFVDRMQGGDFDSAFLEWEERFRLDLVPPERRARLGDLRPRAEIALAYWNGVLTPEGAAALQGGFTAALTAIAVPALLLFADPPPPEDEAILDQMPTSTVEVWSGLGHYLHLADPERFAARLRAWIADLP